MEKLTEFKNTLANSLIGYGEITNVPKSLTAAERMLLFVKNTKIETNGFGNKAIEKASKAVGIKSNPELVQWIRSFSAEELSPILSSLHSKEITHE